MFSLPTDFNSETSSSWPCSNLFNLTSNGHHLSISGYVCSWLSSSSVQITFSSTAIYLPQINDTLVVVGQLKQDCSSTPSLCGIRQSAHGETIRLVGPQNPTVPTVVISTSPFVGPCDDVVLDASGSYGSGLRTWFKISWSVASNSNTTTIASFLNNVNDLVFPITPPRYLFQSGQYNFSLTLENFFLESSTSSVLVTVTGDPYTPLLNLLGQNSYVVYASVPLSLQVQGQGPSCSGAAPLLSYSWAVYSGTLLKPSLVSQSADPRTFFLPAYSLVPENTYSIVSTATTTSGGVASVNVTVKVVKGLVVAVISGGSTQTNPVNFALNLNASASYDQDFYYTSHLSFQWSCSRINQTASEVACAITNFGSLSVSAVLQLSPYSLSIGYTYTFTVNATASDGRYGTASATVIPTTASSSLTVIVGSASYRINQQSAIKLNGRCIASQTCTSFWSVSGSGINPILSNITTTPTQKSFSAGQIQKGVSFPLGIKAGSLISGNTYSFQLSSYLAGYSSTTLSFAVITVVVSGPPTSGKVVSLPPNGTALQTVFSISSIGWTSPSGDYPLQYDFAYQTSPGSTSLQLALKSVRTSVGTTLAAGTAINEFAVNVTGGVYSSYGARASASISVLVVSNNYTVGNLVDYVKNGTSKSLLSYNLDTTLSTVNTASSFITSLSCGSAVNCSSLHRHECGPSTLPQTCGSCFSGYIGVNGSSNLPCKSSNQSWSTSTCSSNVECLYGNCVDDSCVVPSKTCPNNCSYNGICRYYDAYGNNALNCLVNNTLCQARCVCFDDYGGNSCNMSKYDAGQIEETVTSICSTLSTIYSLQDPSSQLLNTLLASLYTAYNSHGSTSFSAFDTCLSVLSNNITKLADNGYIDSQDTINLMANMISAFTVSLAFRQNSTSSNLTQPALSLDNSAYPSQSDRVSNSVTSMHYGVIQYMTDGQYPINISTDSINAMVNRELLTELNNGSIILYNSYESEPPSITLPLTGLDSCEGFSSGYAHYSVMEWVINPYSNSSALVSPLLRWTSSSTTQNLSQPLTNSSESDSFYLFMEYSTFLNLSLTPSVLENRTVPGCVTHDSTGYSSCPCRVSTYTDVNVTFVCESVALTLCPPLAYSRRLSDAAASDVGTTNVAEFGVITQSLAAEFLSVNGAVVDLHAGGGVISFVSVLLFLFIGGLWYFSRWDELDRKHILYVAKANTKKSARDAPDQALMDLRRRIDRAFLTGGLELEDLNEDDEELDRRRKCWRTVLIPKNLRDQQNLLVGGNFFVRFMHAVLRYHPFVCFFVGRSMVRTRALRFLLLCKSLMVSLFTSTLIFGNGPGYLNDDPN